MRHHGSRPGHSAPQGQCTVCGQPLLARRGYWITKHPDGVHQDCRPWERESFPFRRDLQRLRLIARAAMRTWRGVVRDGTWLADAEHNWPARARERAREWLERKRRLEHQLQQLRDRLRF
jgi:hypothetical protein